jgi:hypothetical protein
MAGARSGHPIVWTVGPNTLTWADVSYQPFTAIWFTMCCNIFPCAMFHGGLAGHISGQWKKLACKCSKGDRQEGRHDTDIPGKGDVPLRCDVYQGPWARRTPAPLSEAESPWLREQLLLAVTEGLLANSTPQQNLVTT